MIPPIPNMLLEFHKAAWTHLQAHPIATALAISAIAVCCIVAALLPTIPAGGPDA